MDHQTVVARLENSNVHIYSIGWIHVLKWGEKGKVVLCLHTKHFSEATEDATTISSRRHSEKSSFYSLHECLNKGTKDAQKRFLLFSWIFLFFQGWLWLVEWGKTYYTVGWFIPVCNIQSSTKGIMPLRERSTDPYLHPDMSLTCARPNTSVGGLQRQTGSGPDCMDHQTGERRWKLS